MERREFFQAGALTALAVLDQAGEAGAAADVRLSAEAMDGFLRRLDDHRAWIGGAPLAGVLRAVEAEPGGEGRRCEELIRLTLRSMFLVRSFRDLPEHGRAHPGMQRRIWAALPEMDEAVGRAREYLLNLSAADRLDLQRTLREHPALLPRLAAQLDHEAAGAGIPIESRGQLRGLVEHLDRQMRRQAAGPVLDEYVARADRAAAEAGTVEEMTQRLMARLGAPAFYSLQKRQEELARSWWTQPPPQDYPGSGEVYRMGDEPTDEVTARGRKRVFRAGAIVLGVGVVPTVLGLAFIPFTLGLSAIAATPGVGMLVTGIVLMAVGRRRAA